VDWIRLVRVNMVLIFEVEHFLCVERLLASQE
jgi:hypothetical protein